MILQVLSDNPMYLTIEISLGLHVKSCKKSQKEKKRFSESKKKTHYLENKLFTTLISINFTNHSCLQKMDTNGTLVLSTTVFLKKRSRPDVFFSESSTAVVRTMRFTSRLTGCSRIPSSFLRQQCAWVSWRSRTELRMSCEVRGL